MAWNDPDQLRARFSFVCDAALDPPAPDGTRRCGQCDRSVHPARTAAEFDALARQGLCIYAHDTDAQMLVSAPDAPPPPPVKGTPPHQATAGIPYNPDAKPIRRPPPPPPPPPPPQRRWSIGGMLLVLLAFIGACLLLGVALGAMIRLLLG